MLCDPLSTQLLVQTEPILDSRYYTDKQEDLASCPGVSLYCGCRLSAYSCALVPLPPLAWSLSGCFIKRMLESGEMAQLVKCVPWKRADPDSVSQNPYKNLTVATYSCNIIISALGRWRQAISGLTGN